MRKRFFKNCKTSIIFISHPLILCVHSLRTICKFNLPSIIHIYSTYRMSDSGLVGKQVERNYLLQRMQFTPRSHVLYRGVRATIACAQVIADSSRLLVYYILLCTPPFKNYCVVRVEVYSMLLNWRVLFSVLICSCGVIFKYYYFDCQSKLIINYFCLGADAIILFITVPSLIRSMGQQSRILPFLFSHL